MTNKKSGVGFEWHVLLLIGIILFFSALFSIIYYYFAIDNGTALTFPVKVNIFSRLFIGLICCIVAVARMRRYNKQVKEIEDEIKAVESKAKSLPKKFSYYCPSCLHQTNKFEMTCPKCDEGRLKRVDNKNRRKKTSNGMALLKS